MEIKDIISSGLLEMYVTGLSNEHENVQVEAWKKQYPEVALELLQIEKSLEDYAMSNAIAPAPELKSKIEKAIQSGSDLEQPIQAKVYSIPAYWKWVAAASIVLLVASSIMNFRYYSRMQEAIAAEQSQRQELLAKNERLDELDKNMLVIQSKYSEPVALHGLPAAPDAAAKIFWMKNTGEVYIDPSNLPEAPAGKQYQLWGMVDGKPVDGGMIIKTKTGKTFEIQKMKSFGKVEAFAVTLETEGGNPTPKGDMYVLGKM
ncbi:MAG: anti-sigma factor [Ferruginibacter sp.]